MLLFIYHSVMCPEQNLPPYLSRKGTAILLQIRAVPNASKTCITGLWNNSVKIKLQAPPDGGRANKELIRFLSDTLSLPKSLITIAHGGKSHDKTICLEGITPAFVRSKLGL